MKIFRLSISTILVLILCTNPVIANNLQSDNFKIVDATTNSGGEVTGSSNFNLLNTVGSFSGDPRLLSTNYRAGIGTVEIYLANTPKISCFETTTNGTSQCTTGPSYLNSDGMTTVCGPNGCYDRGRFEIDIQRNPADTLYGIQVSTDSFTTDTRYLDGVTGRPKNSSLRTIADYKTKAGWETDVTNVKGLTSGTQYTIRAVALHGDFTESEVGPSLSATTANTHMSFDLDISDVNGITTESAPPYLVEFNNTRTLIQTGPPRTSLNVIWMDISTNAQGGFALVQKGEYGGLFSTSQNYTVTSENANLDGESEGFGLQSYYTAQEKQTGSGNGDLGAITINPNYSGTGNTVGKIAQVYFKMYESNKPLLNGRMGIQLKARVSGLTPASTDYSEDITFIMIPRY